MRITKTLVPTLKEAPAEAEIPSHILMVRGGYLRKVAAGIYSLLPLGLRVVQKIAAIVRQEMNRSGASEVLLPAVIPGELWKESGRWDAYGKQLLRFEDRKGGDFVIGPTHEEVIVALVRDDVKSYRQLPLNLYQIQSKFRDELRPRAGLMRGREFIMKDAYSFHVDEADARREYDRMYDTYGRIFARCGLAFRAVEADTGAIGGSLSHEFQVLTETGEDALVACDNCDYAANVEEARLRAPGKPEETSVAPVESVETPNQRSIDEVTRFLGVGPSALAKTLIYLADGKPIAILVRGDRALNEIKVKAALGVKELQMADDKVVRDVTGASVGFAGPIGIKCPVFCDLEVSVMRGCVVGANKDDTHLRNALYGRDFESVASGDYRQAEPGDPCPRCETGTFKGFRGIEVGQVFFLGTKYSKPMGCTFLGPDGKETPMVMGCYGIGVTRIAAAAIEQNHDANGIVWPTPIAPFEVHILALQIKDEAVASVSESLHDDLEKMGVEVLFDDRDERPGVKFNDADLIGIPYRVGIGKKGLADGIVEIRIRRSGEDVRVPIAEAAAWLRGRIEVERTGSRESGAGGARGAASVGAV